jgi:hypothetical protein
MVPVIFGIPENQAQNVVRSLPTTSTAELPR